MSQNQNKQSYAHGFIAGGVAAGVGAMRVGGAGGTASASAPSRLHEQRHEYFGAGGGGGGDYTANYWQQQQQQQYQQQQMQQQVFQQRQQRQMQQQLQQRQQQHQQHQQQLQQRQQQHQLQQRQQQQHQFQQRQQQMQLQHRQQLQLQQRQQQMRQYDTMTMKPNTLESNVHVPTIEMDELIIKTEPPDDSGFVNLMENQGSKNVTNPFHRSTFLNNTSFPHIKEEPSTSQQKTLNFPRRKLQTERAETLPICQRCKQVFLKKSTYMKHVRHSSCSILEYNFKCLICPMSFMSPEELQVHENVHRADQFFCQKYCGKYFDTLDLCEAHEFMFHDFVIFTCNVCNGNFKTRDVLFAHKTQHRHLNRFDCPICRRWFSTPGELRKHRLEAPFYCGKFYAEKEDPDNQSIFNKTSWEEANYNLQDCNVGVIEEATPSISSNQTQISKNNDSSISNFQPDITIKSEPDFDNDIYPSPQSSGPLIAPHPVRTHQRSEASFHNVPTSYPNTGFNNFNTNINDHAYNDFKSHYQHLERTLDNNFTNDNFSPPFTPATPAVSENDAICCVPHCGKRKSTNPTLQFFKYPKDEKYLKQWLHNMKLIYNAEESYEDYRICNVHFPKRVINLHSLCYWAVPTYHLGHDDFANIFHNREQSLSSVQCGIRGCESIRGKTNVKFYNFPSSETQVYMKWCQNARLPLNSTEMRQICSRHFEEHCFGKLRLKNWALPTLHLGGFPIIHENPRILFTEDKKCCLQHCRRKRSENITLSFYGFPRDEQLLLRWCYNFRLDPNEYRGKFYKICSAHFVKDVIGTVKLLPGALPTLELGHNDPNIYTNDFYPTSSSTHHNTTSTSSNSSAAAGGIQETPDTCSLPTCKRNRFSDNVSMHTMPGRPEQFKKWCHNLKINPAKLNKHFRVCSIHFEPYCIGGCMRPFAVPTLFLGHDDKNIYHNPKVIKKLSLRETCCVAVCRRNRERDRANLHSFPLHKPELLQKWAHNLQRPMPDGTRLFNDAICEQHFEERCIQNRRLAKWAVPTLLLGHDDDLIQLPSEAEVEEMMAKTVTNEANNGDAGGECCVETCKRETNSDENVKLYFLPDDEEVLDKWAHNLQQPDIKDYAATLRICNLHFESYCIGKKLHSWAIPTLNLPHQLEHIFENPNDMKVLGGLKAPNAPRCCLPSCRKMRIDGQVQLFRFPTYSKSIFKKWCHNLQMSLTSASSSHKRLCSTHFEPCVLTKRCPMPQALPTLNLNCPENYKIYQNPERLKYAKLRNERICCLASCRKGKKDGIQLFLYPHNRNLLRKWAHNTKQKGSECTRAQLRLCSDHFEENCFGPARLVPGAIPTLKLGHDDTDIFPNTLPEISEDGQQCAISGCGRKRAVDGIRLFRFPADDEDLLWKWCNNLKLNPIDCPQQRICNMHFEPDCVGPKGLHKWAIPTMLLGHNDTELQLHTNPPVEERVLPEPILLKCCVARCGKTRKYDDVMLNSFPKTVELFKRWAHNLQMDIRFSDREKYKICNDHFETFCVGQARLRAGAIPTLNLGHDNTADIYPIERADLQGFFQPKQSTTEGSVKSVTAEEIEAEVEIAKCCYPDCTASKSLQRDLLFDFPKCELLANAWSTVTDLNQTEISNPKLCGIHFIVVYDETAETRAELAKTNPELNDDLQVLANSYYRCCSSSLIRSMQCCIPECKTNSLTGIKLYQFPYQRDLKEKWAHNTAIELDENQRHLYKVCALHFEAHCITESQRLRPWAIPTLQLEHVEPVELHQNPDLLSLDRRLLGPQTNKCCVPSCERHENVDDNARLFNFPIEESIIDKWLHNLRVVEREKCPLYRICSWHFEKRCISKSGRLRSWAIPTLKLRNDDNSDNDDDDDIIQNPEKPGAASVASSVSSKEPQQTAAESEASSSTDVIKGCKMKKNLDLIKCCVATCQKRRLQHGVRFYTTPSDIKMIRKWSHILQLSVAELKKEQHICNEHFAKRCIDGKQLYAWAIPTMNLGSASISDTKTVTSPTIEKTTTIEHETKEPSTQFNLYLPTCCVPNCGRRRTPENAMRTFGFPLNPKLLRRWCTNLRIDPSGLKGPRVCIYHFEEEVRGKQKLKPGTVPTLNLGHDDGPTYDNKALLQALKEKENSALLAEASVENADNTLETNMDTNLEESTENTEISNENENGCTTTKSAADDEHDADDVVEVDEDKTQLFNSPTTKRCKQKNTLAIPTKSDSRKTQETKEHTTQLNLYLPTCCVPNCGRRRTVENAMRTFGFPLDPELLRRWCTNLRMDPTGLKYPRVCVYHFEEEIRGKTKLKHGAVPTLNLGHDDGPTYDNKALLLALKEKENSTLTENPETTVETTVENITEPEYENCCCAVTGCSSTLKSTDNDENDDDNKTQFFNFPSESTMLQKWCDNLQLKSDACDFLKVCKRHFEPQCFGIRTSLYMWAVPTLHLGLDELTPLPHDNSKYIKVVQTDNTLEGNLKRCCIATCQKTRRSHGVTLFSFPKPSQLLLRKWCHNTRQAFKRRQKRRICSDHFEKYTMSNGKLRAWALPTLQLGHTEPIYENPTNMFDKCCISTCESNENTQQLFSFPKRSSQLRKWAHNTKQDAYLAIRRNYKVCGLHFEKNCISASGLNFGAIPTLELGPQDVDDADLKENFANEVIATRDVQDVSCSIANCGRKLAKDGIILYPFPKEQELLEKWCHNLKLETEKCEDLYICNMHFETGLVRKYKLVEDAVPTLLLGHNDKTLELIKAPQLSNAVLHCCVPNCNKSKPNDDVQMVGFPKKPALYLKWIHNLKIKPNQTFSKVCSDHFEDICMATSRLKHGSIPTLKLGHDDTNIYHNSKKVLITAEERRKLDKCIVSDDCNVSKMLQLKLFDMPKVETLLQRWLTHFGIEFNDNIEVEPKICAIHFMDAYEKLCPSNDTDTTQETDDSTEEDKHELANLVAAYTQITHLPRLRILLCSVPGCKSKFTDSDIRLIMFPKNAETCAKWCHNTKVNFDEERRYLYKICSLHFEDYCYANTRLHNWAIPTLRLPETDNDIYQNPEPEEEQPEVCCVESCKTTSSIKLHNIDDQIDDSTEVPEEAPSAEVVKKLFSFPADETILQKWCHNLDIPTGTETRGLKICSAHFENYTVGKLLRPWAIPTLKLSRDPATLFTNPEIKDLPTGRTVTCCVRDCRQQRDDEAGIKLFAFPFKQELRQKWLHNLELKDHADDCKSYRVCSLHFERHCVGKRLHNWAIPTLRLCQGDETVLYKNPRLSKKKLNAKCCLKHCRKSRRQNQVRLYSFPETEPQILKKWLHNLRLDNTALKRKICSSHFEKYCIYKGFKRLHPWAIPTLELGHKDVIFENPKGKKLKLQQLPTAKERCALSFCEMQQSLSATGESTLRFFGFPCAEDLLQKWCDNLKLHMAGYRCTKQRICEYHFETQALNDKKLLPGAVPTLNLGHTDVVEHQNPADMCKYRMCSVPHCKAEMSKEVKLFDLPLKNITLLQKWCENLQLDVESCKSGQYTKICNAHFVPAAFAGNTLKPFVVPTLKLGHNNAVIHENSTQILESEVTDQCVVTDCAAHLEPHGNLFIFPKKPKRIQKWCENLKLNFAGSTMQHICREHFDSSCFDPNDDQSLLDWALPTLNLGHIEQLPYERKKSSTGKSSLSLQKRSQCCVTTCQQSNAQLYKFPTINWLVKKWCHNLRRPEEGTENLKICVRHFEKHCLGISKPKPWAIPTLELGHTGEIHQSMKIHKYHPEEKACGEMKFVRSNYCAIVSCLKSKQDGVQLYKYPSKGAMLHKWAHNCRHRAYQAARYVFRICREHFEDQCITAENRLRPGAIPTLKLGHDDIDIHPHEVLDCPTPSSNLSEVHVTCNVPNCGRTKLVDNVKFFKFPKDAEMLEKWCYNLRLEMMDGKVAKDMRICNMHFEERCFSLKKIRLLLRAVPTLLLGHNDIDDIYENPETFERPEKVLRCCVPDCGIAKGEEENVSLFCLPKNRKLFDQWVQNIRLDIKPTTESYLLTRVCSMHFEDYCSVGQSVRRLLYGAIPTLKLGHNDKNIHHVQREVLSSTLGELRKRKREEDSIKKLDAQCCVPNCNAKDYHIYAIPQHSIIQHMWHTAFGILEEKDDSNSDEEKQLCAIHFKIAYVKTHNEILAAAADDSLVAVLKELTRTFNEISSSSRVRSIWCSVSGCCGNTYSGGVELKLHAFPQNSEIYEKWLHNTQVEVDEQQRYLFKVCSLHFEARCVKETSKRLYPWAVPTLNLPLKDIPTVIIQNPSIESLETKNTINSNLDASCCIATCVNAAKKKEDNKSENEEDEDDEDEKPLSSIALYKFPRDVHLFRKWLYNTQMDANKAIHARICGRHFEHACIGKILKPWAIPTMHLGHNNPNIHQNPKEEMTAVADIKENEVKFVAKGQETKLEPLEKTTDVKPAKELLKDLLKKDEIKCASFASLLSPKWEQDKIARSSTPKVENNKKPIILELLTQSCIKNSDMQENSRTSFSNDNSNTAEKSLVSGEKDEQVFISESEEEKVNEIEEDYDDVIFTVDDDDDNDNDIDDNMMAEDDELLAIRESVIEEDLEAATFNPDEMDEDDTFDESAAFDAQTFSGTEFKEYNDEVFYSLGDEPPDLLYSTPPTEDIQSCRVAGCTSRVGQPDIVLHKFPSNALLRNRWLHNTKVKWDPMRPWAYKICSLHFESQYYTSMTNRLTAYAIPTLNLGHTRPEKIYDTAVASNWKPGGVKSTTQPQIVKKLEQKPLKPKLKPPYPLLEQPTSSFNFKITAIESISMNATTPKVTGADDDYGMDSDSNSVSSTEYQLQQYSDATNPASAGGVRSSNTTNLSCSIPSCQRKTNQDFVQLHMLPKDTALLQQWCRNCKLSPSPHELYTTRVCSYHFEDQCFTRSRRQLKLGSLPTLNLGHNDEIYQNLRQPGAPLLCCVAECGRRRVEDHARLFRFPTDKRMLSKWLHNLQMEFNAARPWNYNVCEKHFEDYCFGKAGSIMPWAVPTLHLGSNAREQRDLRLNERPLEDQINDDDLFIMPDSAPTEIESHASASEPNFNKKSSTEFKSNNVFYEQHYTFKKNLLKLKDDIKITTISSSKCIVPNCGLIQTGDFRMQMFALPKDPQLRQKWTFNMKMLNYTYNPDNSGDKICVRHFERSAILGPNVLKKSAVPTLNLGHNDRNIYLNVDEETKYVNHAFGSAADALQAMAKIKIEPFEEQLRPKADPTVLQFHQYENQFNSPTFPATDSDTNSSFNRTPVIVNTDSLKCFLKHCKRRRIDGVKLFRFPREQSLQAQWEHNLKMVFDEGSRERLFLCSTHFEPQFMGRKFLMKGAIPTLNLGHNDTNIFRADAWSLSEESSESVTPLRNGAGSFNAFAGVTTKQSHQAHTTQISCCVPGCGLKDTGSENVLFFPFPLDEKYARIWQQRFRINYDPSRRIKLRVCNIHFEPHLICRKSLVQHAVPTLNLPPPVPHLNKQLSRLIAAPITSPSTSSNTCNVTGCHKNTMQDNVKMFSKFPDDFELFTKWCYNLKIDPRKYIDGKYNVCSSHFEAYCIGGHSLRLWAVPTLNLGHNDANIHQVKRPAEMETKCCLPHCGRRRSTDGVTFYNFPKGDLYKTWCKILNIDELLYRNTDKKICSAHFAADCFNGLTLKAGVKPTLYLRARPAVATAGATMQHHQPSNQQLFKIHDAQPNVPGCLLTHCSNNSTNSSGVQFFAFPDKRYLCMKWCHNLRLNYSSQMLYNKRIYKICYKHFELSCIYNAKLHTEAVPTLELGHTDVNIFQNTGSFSTLTNDSSSISSNSTTGFPNAMGGGGENDSSLLYVKEEIMDEAEMEQLAAEPMEDIEMLNNFAATFYEPKV